ncbi:BMP family lipoprotein [Cohnella caldifontis]|uniref:BMP family lipoprotein n=1 Tax=Cohnella caldifontis TaxID=3027471 RepID=UPI0023EC2AA4|nr:BMP family ABC transporter substrate-binding protein [Cohnella sp. YIM B05605]
MKRIGWLKFTALALAFLMVLAGCGKGGSGSSASGNDGGNADGGKKLSAAFYVNGTLGDKGFFDSAQVGMEKAQKELGYDIKTVEGGTNQADWAAGFESLVSSGKYDVILTGTSQMTEIVKDVAARYPKQKIVFFDDKITDIPNVYSMLFSQSEGSFLAGAFAALVTESKDLPNANPDKVIGFVGGMDIPIINDFKAGYEQGAQYVDPDVKIVASFIGDFANAPKGKELALAQYNTQKADIVFQVAGGAGLGVLEASKSAGKYSIGVDGNQNPLYPGNVLTSMMKNNDAAVYRAFDLFKQGTLPFGKNEVLGLKEGGVGLAKDDLYDKNVPQAIKDKMKEIEDKLSSGEIQVKSIL